MTLMLPPAYIMVLLHKLLIERQNRHYKNYRDIEDCCNVGETFGWLPYLPYDWVDHRW